MQDATDRWSRAVARRQWTRRQVLVGWGVAGLEATLLSACGPAVAPAPAATTPAVPAPPTSAQAVAQPTAVQARDGGTLHFIASTLTADPPTLDPYLNVSYLVQSFAGYFYSRLLMSKKGPDVPALAYVMEGDLAESWKASDDGTTWTFTLRPNVTWHNVSPMNGRPLTAQDVTWSFDRFMQSSPQKSTFDQVASVTALDATTVQFVLKDSYAPFETLMGAPIFWILPREVVEQAGNVSHRIVGSGPFMFDKLESAVSYSGHKNPAPTNSSTSTE